jgi:hypothetical protein
VTAQPCSALHGFPLKYSEKTGAGHQNFSFPGFLSLGMNNERQKRRWVSRQKKWQN